MFEVVAYQNKCKVSKETSTLANIDAFCQKLFDNNIPLDYHKLWVYQEGNLFAVIDCVQKQIRYVSDMKFTNPDANEFQAFPKAIHKVYYDHLYDRLVNIYRKFIISVWGEIVYLYYNDLPKGDVQDIETFVKKYKGAYIENILKLWFKKHLMNSNKQEYDEKFVDNFRDELDWIGEGMRRKEDSHVYLNQTVIDGLFGLSLEPIKKQTEVYRVWGLHSGEEKGLTYSGWVSTSLNYEQFDTNVVEKFVLPVGFPVVNTEIRGVSYADSGELIVRNEDLVQL